MLVEDFDQYEHKQIYSLPRSAKLKGFVVVNEEKGDMLSFFNPDDLETVYTKDPNLVMIFKTIEKSQAVIEKLSKPLLVSALYEFKKQLIVACVLKYSP